uniref:Peroxisomal membrane protein 11C isoform X1 n=1 Tax=Pogona vitticeps TaxID=103695 RepID=A0A6J0SPC3_9SAUR
MGVLDGGARTARRLRTGARGRWGGRPSRVFTAVPSCFHDGVRTLSYACQLAGGLLVARSRQGESPLGHGLLTASAQLSHCRTVLRLFDDLSMLAYSCQYGLGRQEEDAAVRWLSVLTNLADQLYYPCEHVAWAAEARILPAEADRWWALSTALWGVSLLLGIARSLRILSRLRSQLRKPPSGSASRKTRARAKAEALTILSNLADLANAVHWMPVGLLWAGRFPPWLVGLLGSISSLLGIYLTYDTEGHEE